MFSVSAFLVTELKDESIGDRLAESVFQMRRAPEVGDLVQLDSLRALGYGMTFRVAKVVWMLDPETAGYDVRIEVKAGGDTP